MERGGDWEHDGVERRLTLSSVSATVSQNLFDTKGLESLARGWGKGRQLSGRCGDSRARYDKNSKLSGEHATSPESIETGRPIARVRRGPCPAS
jgi:hypothetical protein